MIEVRLEEGERLTDVAGIGLAQGVVPVLHVLGLPAVFSHAPMSFGGKGQLVGFSEVTEAVAEFVLLRNSGPQLPTRLFTTISNHKSYNLPPQGTIL